MRDVGVCCNGSFNSINMWKLKVKVHWRRAHLGWSPPGKMLSIVFLFFLLCFFFIDLTWKVNFFLFLHLWCLLLNELKRWPEALRHRYFLLIWRSYMSDGEVTTGDRSLENYILFLFLEIKVHISIFSDLYYWMRWRGHQELPCHWDCRNSGCLPCLKVKVKITNVFLLLFSNYNKNQLKRNQLSPRKKISSKISVLYSRFWKKVTCKSILGIGKTTVWFFSVEILFRTFRRDLDILIYWFWYINRQASKQANSRDI